MRLSDWQLIFSSCYLLYIFIFLFITTLLSLHFLHPSECRLIPPVLIKLYCIRHYPTLKTQENANTIISFEHLLGILCFIDPASSVRQVYLHIIVLHFLHIFCSECVQPVQSLWCMHTQHIIKIILNVPLNSQSWFKKKLWYFWILTNLPNSYKAICVPWLNITHFPNPTTTKVNLSLTITLLTLLLIKYSLQG